MYINLYTPKQLEGIRERMLWLGSFMMSGGLAALIYNLLLQESARWHWAMAALLVTSMGISLLAIGIGKIRLKETFFSVTSSTVSYRLYFFGFERSIAWQDVSQLQLSDHYILFNLYSGKQVSLRLGAIQSDNTASHIALSLQTEALRQHVTVNGVRFNASSQTNPSPSQGISSTI